MLFLIGGNYVHDMNNYGGSQTFNGNSTFVNFMKNFGGVQKGNFQTNNINDNSKMVNMANNITNQTSQSQ